MSERVLDKRTASVYGVAMKNLHRIGVHPDMVEKNYLGNVLTIKNITEKVGSLDPTEWFKGQQFEGSDITLDELPSEDRVKIETVLENLIAEPRSHEDLRSKFIACEHLAIEFSKKILEKKKPAFT